MERKVIDLSASKEEFISNYLNKKMKNHGLPYGLQYMNLLSEQEDKAEKAWKRYCNKIFKSLIEQSKRESKLIVIEDIGKYLTPNVPTVQK